MHATIYKRGPLSSQHFEYGSNYGHAFPVSRTLAPMRDTYKAELCAWSSEVTRGGMVRT